MPGRTARATSTRRTRTPIIKCCTWVRGSITWLLPETDQAVETTPGDRIDLPRGTLHGARVGPGGVTCLEAHLG